jgi:hypothetical protein
MNKKLYQEPIDLGNSYWRNDTNNTARFRILLSEVGRKPFIGLFKVYKVDPGETVEIPAKYDRAIRKVDSQSNKIIGGIAPNLTKVDEAGNIEDNAPELSDAMNADVAILDEQVAKLTKNLTRQKILQMKLQDLQDAESIVNQAVETVVKKVGRPKKSE